MALRTPVVGLPSHPKVGRAALLAALLAAATGRAQTNDNREALPPFEVTAAPEAPASAPTEAPAPKPDAAAAKPLEEADVTIAGTRVQHTPGSAHVISNKKLERNEYDDPQALLQTVPGVYARGEDGVGLRPNIGLRGTNPNRSSKVALMED